MTDRVDPLTDGELAYLSEKVRDLLVKEFGGDRVNKWIRADIEITERFARHTFYETRVLLHKKGMN